MSNSYILVLYSSRDGSTRNMAKKIAYGIETTGINAMLRTVAPISAETEKITDEIPDTGHLYASLDELANCSGLALGSPVNFGNMSSALKYFVDSSTSLWLSGKLVGKPAGVFVSGSSMHGGQETTLISMMLPLLHHGMIISGLPFSEKSLVNTKTGGAPYGPSHVSGIANNTELSEDEALLCKNFGKRLAKLVLKLGEQTT